MALAILSVHDPDFLRGARTDLEGTLETYGFALNDQEMDRAKSFLAEFGSEVTDEAIVQALEAPGGEAERRW